MKPTKNVMNYEKPIFEKESFSSLQKEIWKELCNGRGCMQCSGCHGCRG